MIKSINDFCLFSKSEAEKLSDDFLDRFVYLKKSLDVFDIDIASKLGLPNNYVEIVQKYNISNVDIGYFSLHPGSGVGSDLEAALVRYNGDGSPFLSLFHQNDLVQIAREESNPICVKRSDAEKPGEVYHIEVMSATTPRISEIAPDFETYVVMTANLQDISTRFDENPAAAESEMAKCCAEANLNVRETGFWVQRSIFNTDA
jgi:hypothetical protein